jgi:hypothetical protein
MGHATKRRLVAAGYALPLTATLNMAPANLAQHVRLAAPLGELGTYVPCCKLFYGRQWSMSLAPALVLREGDRTRLGELARLPSVPSGPAKRPGWCYWPRTGFRMRRSAGR